MGRRTDGKGDTGGVSARLSLWGFEPGRARQSLKKVIWNPSPMRMASPPGNLPANRKREYIAPPLGSTLPPPDSQLAALSD